MYGGAGSLPGYGNGRVSMWVTDEGSLLTHHTAPVHEWSVKVDRHCKKQYCSSALMYCTFIEGDTFVDK
jgi:hypothetical protein